MKHVLFLQDLDQMSRDEAGRLLKSVGCDYQLTWYGDSDAGALRDEVEILVTSEHRVDSSLLGAWPKLKMVSLAFTGYDRVDLRYTRANGIRVYYVPAYAAESVAELNLALTLSI